jgi:hypothetical protein
VWVLPNARMESQLVKERGNPALSQVFTRQTSSQSKEVCDLEWICCVGEKGWDVEGVAEGMGLQGERVVLISETLTSFFLLSVR